MKYIHLAKNRKLGEEDKFTKVRPLYDLMNQCFAKLGTVVTEKYQLTSE